MLPTGWLPTRWLPEGWLPESHEAAGQPDRTVILPGSLGPLTLPGALAVSFTLPGSLLPITLPGDAEMGMYGHLTICRGEDVELLVPITATEPITDWPLRFQLFDLFAQVDGAIGNVLAEYTSGAGITAVDSATARVVLLSADTDRVPRRYWFTLTRTGPGRKGVILYGPVDIKPPPAV